MGKDIRPPKKNLHGPSGLSIRAENVQTWILTDRSTRTDVGGVTYVHSADGDHYQAWLLVDGARVAVGLPSSQLGQAAQVIERELLKRSDVGVKRD
jgi:hypothetical protein